MLTLNIVPNKFDVPWFLVVQTSMSFEWNSFSLKVINFLQVRTLAILQPALLENQECENLDRQCFMTGSKSVEGMSAVSD